MNNWKNIWNKRQISNLTEINRNKLLEFLIKYNGFDGGSGSSSITVEAWTDYISLIKNKLSILEDDSIFEVGCGCGALLYPFYTANHFVGGIDYSDILIQQAKTIMPNAELLFGEACDIIPPNNNTNNTHSFFYDYVISNSIFFIFQITIMHQW